MTVVPLAHAGHWAPYLAPVIVVLIGVILATLHERRARETGRRPPGAGE